MNFGFDSFPDEGEPALRKAKAFRPVPVNERTATSVAAGGKGPALEHRIFVDFENVQEIDLNLINGIPLKVMLLIGERQKQLKVPFVKQLLQYSSEVRLFEIHVSGKNALDFVLACEVGKAVALAPKTRFYIVSRDKGFDALVAHLVRAGVGISRHDRFSSIPLFLKEGSEVADGRKEELPPEVIERVDRVVENLSGNKVGRPRKKPALLSYIKHLFQKKLPKRDVEKIFQSLLLAGMIHLDSRQNLEYRLPDFPAGSDSDGDEGEPADKRGGDLSSDLQGKGGSGRKQ